MSAYIDVKATANDIRYNCSFPTTNNSVTFEADGDDSIIDILSITNISTIVIGTTTIYSSSTKQNLPYALVRGNGYTITITRTDINAVSSFSLRTMLKTSLTKTVSALDLDVTITNTYVLCTGGYVAVLAKSLLSLSNYLGGGAWTTQPYSVLTLPVVADVTNFQWHTVCHIKYNNLDYVAVFGSQTTGATNRHLYVCLINPSTLSITDLDGSSNQKTQITNNSAITTGNVACEMIQENPIDNLLVASANPGYSILIEIDLLNRRYTNPFPFVATTYPKLSFFNITDKLYTCAQGCFSKTRSANVTEANGIVYGSHQCYDYLRGGKICTSTYAFRHVIFDKNGLVIGGNTGLTNYSTTALGYICKKNCLATYDTSYFYVLNQNSTVKNTRFAHENKTFTSINDRTYVNENGRVWMLTTNVSRLHLYFVDIEPTTPTCTQAYIDLPYVPITKCTMCTDKTNISL